MQDAYDLVPAHVFLKKSLHKGRKKHKPRRGPNVPKEIPRPEYKAYLRSDAWRNLKKQIIRERGAMCERCGAFGEAGLEMHHLSYVRLGHEDREDLKLYCQACHSLMHRRLR